MSGEGHSTKQNMKRIYTLRKNRILLAGITIIAYVMFTYIQIRVSWNQYFFKVPLVSNEGTVISADYDLFGYLLPNNSQFRLVVLTLVLIILCLPLMLLRN